MEVMISGDRQETSTMMSSINRHLRFAIGHMTFKKMLNILVCLLEMQLKRSKLMSHPCYLRVEVCPYCNLRCPGCMLGGLDITESSPEHRTQMMDLTLFTESVACFLPYLVKVNLYDEGEPLLNKEIYSMITYLAEQNVSTCVSSNFSFALDDNEMTEILRCGLEHLIVAVDGATPESYSRYRRGGNLHLVLGNVTRLMAMRKELRSSLKVELQFIEFEHNKNERQDVMELARALQVWRFTVIQGSVDGWKGTEFTGSEEERRKRGCYQLWMSGTINSVGELGVCDYGEDHGVPNIGRARDYVVDTLRNHTDVVNLRRAFAVRSVPLGQICRHCSLYRDAISIE